MDNGNVKIHYKNGIHVTTINIFFVSDLFLEFVKHKTINRKMVYH